MTKFADKQDFPNQTLTKTSTGYVWDINDDFLFQMYFDSEGVFEFSLQEDYEDGVRRFEKPNGNTPEPLTSEQMQDADKG